MNRIRRVIVVLGFLVLSAGIQNALAATPASGPPATSQGGANTFIEPPLRSRARRCFPAVRDSGLHRNHGRKRLPGGIGELQPPNDVRNIFATVSAGSLYVIGFLATRLVESAFSLDIECFSLGGPSSSAHAHGWRVGVLRYLPAVVLLIAAAHCAYLLLVTTRFMRGLGGSSRAGAAVALEQPSSSSPRRNADDRVEGL